jgi:hypothetical protein
VYLLNGRRRLVAAATVIGALGVAPTAALAGCQTPLAAGRIAVQTVAVGPPTRAVLRRWLRRATTGR